MESWKLEWRHSKISLKTGEFNHYILMKILKSLQQTCTAHVMALKCLDLDINQELMCGRAGPQPMALMRDRRFRR